MVDRDSNDEENQAEEKVGYTITANAVESADSSIVVPASVEFDPSKRNSVDLHGELELARKEIAELKKQLSTITAERGAGAQ